MKQKRELFMTVIVADGEGEPIKTDDVEEIIFQALKKKYGKDVLGVQYDDDEWGEPV
jgi:hypothetical protein